MNEYYKIKDDCRQGLIKSLENIISTIPKERIYRILDVGCGTGVPTLFLADRYIILLEAGRLKDNGN